MLEGVLIVEIGDSKAGLLELREGVDRIAGVVGS